ncbi:uncharacterized protein DSM5745_05907 [Aspergillus mulundensis]|uniref:Uncharacterized protein n=1 Tax=Aspergillus mulundensis TaxID=1810919 RepID=A0A3D8RYE5_9EURO|nr:Uncharacterized protein DSM5745_05907 [Aspergillus mulundensis]RDW79055.1 Uncharacterized protein DSM5745_05907 [Aspergillus mulundensis]
MPPKRRTRTSKPQTRKPTYPSSPEQEPVAPGEHTEQNDSEIKNQESDEPEEPLTPEEINSPEPVLETDEEMPEETEHTVSEAGSAGEGTSKRNQGFPGGYNALKSYKGQYYSGMAVGGSHTWNYDEGVWKETKEEPDLWRIDYRTNKRRARKAPQGSGAPVGTEYHWLIVAHQHVKKIDANTYETVLEGSKYKLAYKSAASNSWSVPTVRKQRERELELLDDAKSRIQGLPPVSEKIKVEKQEKGQKKLDAMFGLGNVTGTKRKAGE